MRKIRRQFAAVLFALAGLLWVAPAHAADAGKAAPSEPSVDAALTQTRSPEKPIRAGESVTVTLKIDHPAGASVEVPESFEPDRWVLVDTDTAATSQEKSTSTVVAVTFGIFRPGTTTLKPFEVRIVERDGSDVVLTTEPVTVKVISRFADAETEPSFEAARPPVPIWVEDMTLAWVGGGVAAAALLGLFLFAAARREAMRPEPPPPPRAPHEIALEKLGALAGDDLVERGEYMLFWVRLSEAIREYLGRTHGFAPTELTTSEILRELDSVYWPPGLDLEDVADFLRHCDQVKFAGHVPGMEESSQALRRAFSIVELTRPGGSSSADEDDTDDTRAETETETETRSTAEEPEPRDGASRWAPPTDLEREEEE